MGGAPAARQVGGGAGEGGERDGSVSGSGGNVGERLRFERDLGKTPVKHPARPKFARENEISGPST